MRISKFHSPVFEARHLAVEHGESILYKSYELLMSEARENDFDAKKKKESKREKEREKMCPLLQ